MGLDPAGYLRELDRTITAAKRDAEERTRFVKGLELARESVASQILTDAINGNGRSHRRRSTTTFNGDGSRSAMLRKILDNAPHPVTVDEILAEMRKHNVEDDKTNVRSTLSALKKQGAARNPERGKWIGAGMVQSSRAA